MAAKRKTPREQALENIEVLVNSEDFEFYIDVALDALGGKLAKNSLFESLGINEQTAGIAEVLEVLVKHDILPEEAGSLPNDFAEAVRNIYPFGNTRREIPAELLASLHEYLEDAIEQLAAKRKKPARRSKK